jgi:hypothetical protein
LRIVTTGIRDEPNQGRTKSLPSSSGWGQLWGQKANFELRMICGINYLHA